jgi:DNA replication protein DnaC
MQNDNAHSSQPTNQSATQTAPSGDEAAIAEIRAELDRSIRKAKAVVEAGDSSEFLKHRAYETAVRYLKDFENADPAWLLAERRERARQQEESRREGEERERQQRWKETIEERGIRYRNCTLASFQCTCEKQTAAVEVLKSYCADMPTRVQAGSGIVLIGPAGNGKDHLATAVMRTAVLRYGIGVRWTSGPDLWEFMRDGMKSEEGEGRRLRDFIGAQILVISDPALPGQPLTAYQSDVLYRVVDSRYNNLRPTFVTANVKDRLGLEQLLGGAVVDRITDGALIVACDWPSYRKPEGRRP